MSALEAYHDDVRVRVARAVRARGYVGHSEDWHVVGASGDHGMISTQRNRLSDDRLVFRVHLAVTPGPWWEYLGWSDLTPRTTHGLWRQTLTPTTDHVEHRGERWWLVHDRDSARRCGVDVLRGLTGGGFDQVGRLLHRPTLIRTVRRGDLGRRRAFRHVLLTELLLLHADEGDALGFARVVAELDKDLPPSGPVLAWAEERLQLRTRTRASPEA
ncbi:hypothetical protein [Sanguibacter suaedae]|uniref:DUF4304 domain-containing protein n=1 Tax=Sanguibacter suaedae TaxID=2795737 RepID=A0A934I9C2_9MICO|nr:hypothetical protein [Sanguibacter suaedae]MBI9113610.1 hypothetical protein [Sanguibacter suaedae]